MINRHLILVMALLVCLVAGCSNEAKKEEVKQPLSKSELTPKKKADIPFGEVYFITNSPKVNWMNISTGFKNELSIGCETKSKKGNEGIFLAYNLTSDLQIDNFQMKKITNFGGFENNLGGNVFFSYYDHYELERTGILLKGKSSDLTVLSIQDVEKMVGSKISNGPLKTYQLSNLDYVIFFKKMSDAENYTPYKNLDLALVDRSKNIVKTLENVDDVLVHNSKIYTVQDDELVIYDEQLEQIKSVPFKRKSVESIIQLKGYIEQEEGMLIRDGETFSGSSGYFQLIKENGEVVSWEPLDTHTAPQYVQPERNIIDIANRVSYGTANFLLKDEALYFITEGKPGEAIYGYTIPEQKEKTNHYYLIKIHKEQIQSFLEDWKQHPLSY